MARRFVAELVDRDAVDEVYQVADKKLRPNRNGDLYLQLDLSDRTGAVSARLWNATEDLYRSFQEGDFVRIEGRAQVYQGEMQIIASRVSKVSPEKVDLTEFLPHTAQQLDRLTLRLRELLRSLNDVHLRNLAECFLIDDEFMSKFTRCPAGIKTHHAYLGGLLEHVVTLMELAARITPFYPQLNRDLLLMGVFLHDMGKIDELAYDTSFRYTDEGQLVGHLVMAVGILETKVREAEKLAGEPLPKDLVLRLKHMIVSHHGQYEYGSPKLPMTLEAVVLWQLDNLDAKLQSFHQQMLDDPNVDSLWTLYNPSLGRKLFKSVPASADGAS